MKLDRRRFLAGSAALAASSCGLGAARPAAIRPRVGSCMIDLDAAKAAGLAGVEVNAGPAADTLAIATPAEQARLREAMDRTGLPVRSIMTALFNEYPLATDPRAPKWLEQSIDAAKALDAKVILLAFFAAGDLLDDSGHLKAAEFEAAIARIKAAAPRAADAGVTLGIENYLDGRLNRRMLDAIDHPAVSIYYDVFNTGATKGYDVPAEIRSLGRRISQVHFKNGSDLLGTGPLPWREIARALTDVGYDGWIVLETSAPSGDAVADARRNAEFVRGLFD